MADAEKITTALLVEAFWATWEALGGTPVGLFILAVDVVIGLLAYLAYLQYLEFLGWKRKPKQRSPMKHVKGVLLGLVPTLLITAFVFVYQLATLRERHRADALRPLPQRDRFVRDSVTSLIYELGELAGEKFPAECSRFEGGFKASVGQYAFPAHLRFLFPPAYEFPHKLVDSLEVIQNEVNALHITFSGFASDDGKTPRKGYERVWAEFEHLRDSADWLVAGHIYTPDGGVVRVDGKPYICIYGVRSVDDLAVKRFMAELDAVEKFILTR